MENSNPTGHRKRRETAPRDAEATKARILDAARVFFSQNSYEGVGVRDIAGAAGVDAALVVRYFGSKEGLFRTIVEEAFSTHDLLRAEASGLPDIAAEMLSGPLDSEQWRSGYDPLRLLLCSIGSVTAGPIVSEYLRENFIAPIRDALQGHDRNERAALLAGNIVGVALVRIALSASTKQPLKKRTLKELLVHEMTRLVKS